MSPKRKSTSSTPNKRVCNVLESSANKKLAIIRKIKYIRKEIFEIPAVVDGIMLLTIEKLEVIAGIKKINSRIRELFENREAVQGVMRLSTEKLEIISKIEDIHYEFKEIFENSVVVESLMSISAEKLEIVSKIIGIDLTFKVIFENSAAVHGIMSLSTEKLKVVTKFEDFSSYIDDIFENPASVEALENLSIEKLKVIGGPGIYMSSAIENIFKDPAAVEGLKALSTGKLRVIIKLKKFYFSEVLLDLSILNRYLKTDIERNFRFTSFLDSKNTIFDTYFECLDSKAVYQMVNRFIDTHGFSMGERVEMKIATNSLFQCTKWDNCICPIKLQELALIESLKKV